MFGLCDDTPLTNNILNGKQWHCLYIKYTRDISMRATMKSENKWKKNIETEYNLFRDTNIY